MNDFEQLVKDALDVGAASPPPRGDGDPAGGAVRRAGTIRRFRAGTTVAVVFVATALAVGAGALATRPDAASAPPAERPTLPAPATTAIDYVLDGVLHSRSGRYPVGGAAASGSVVRVPGGWVYDDGRGVLHGLGRDGADAVLTTRADAYVVSADGRRVAWISGRRLTVAVRDGDRLVDPRSTTLPAQKREVLPVTWVGTAWCSGSEDRAVAARAVCPRLVPRFDTWDPAHGDYVPTWTDGIAAVWGVAADGRTVIGAVVPGPGSEERCIAALDPLDRLRVLRRACVGLRSDLGSVSPGGRWLAVQGDGIEAFEVATVFGRPVPVPMGPSPGAGEGLGTAWYDDRTLAVARSDGLGRAWTPSTGALRSFPLPPGARLVR